MKLIFLFIIVSIHQRSLASLSPGEKTRAVLETITKVITNPQVVTRSKLFVKLDKLVDGVQHLTLSGPSKTKDFDVVTKGALRKTSGNAVLPLHCLRCGGESRLVAPSGRALRWSIWERSWILACVCGGLWSSRSSTDNSGLRQ